MAFEDIIKRASQKYGVSEKLIYEVINAESSFDPNVVSSAGAQGLMQLMPGTAKELGVTDPFDPEQNIMGGTKYLAQAIQKNNGNISYALAAYNAGQGAVDKYGGIPPYKETQNYVKKIMDALGGKDSSTGIGSGDSDTIPGSSGGDSDLKWWGDIVLVILVGLAVLVGIVFFVMAFTDGLDIKKSLKKGGKK